MFRILISIFLLLSVSGCAQDPYTAFVNDRPFLDGIVHGGFWFLMSLGAIVGLFYLRLDLDSKWFYIVPAALFVVGCFQGYRYVNTPCAWEDLKPVMSSCPNYKRHMFPSGSSQ